MNVVPCDVLTVTASGAIMTGAGRFLGCRLTGTDGAVASVVVYDNTSGAAPIIARARTDAAGTTAVCGPPSGASVQCNAGIWVVVTGTPLVEVYYQKG